MTKRSPLSAIFSTARGAASWTGAAALLHIFSVSSALAQAPPATAPKPPCSAPAYRQFDFWLGDWIVTSPDGKPQGTNLVTRPLGECVIQEHWKGQGGSVGESYNIFDSVSRRWHQTWVDNGGTYLSLEGGLVGNDMVLTGPERVIRGQRTIDRITWQPKSADEVHQIWDTSSDSGQTWSNQFHGVYRRRK